MKTNLLILAGLVTVTALWTIKSYNFGPNLQKPASLVPDFSYTTIGGQNSNLHNHKGNVILLHFWASWCAPCIVEFPSLIALAEKQNKNLIVLAVSTDEKEQNVKKFLSKIKNPLPPNFHIIQDTDKQISQEVYNTLKLPETYVIAPDLTIFQKIIGPEESWDSPQWYDKISTLTGE